jgi:hypothetical protein
MKPIDTHKRHYRDLSCPTGDDTDEHPVDRIVGALPEVTALDDAAREMATQMAAPGADRSSDEWWAECEDLRFQQRALREERFFDVGYEVGRLAGIAEVGTFEARDEVDGTRRRVLRVLVQSRLSRHEAAALIVEIARAFLSPTKRPTDPSGT